MTSTTNMGNRIELGRNLLRNGELITNRNRREFITVQRSSHNESFASGNKTVVGKNT